MQTIIKLNDVDFRIKAKFLEDVKGFPFDKNDSMWHNKYNITITNMETKQRTSLKFYGSQADWQNGKIDFNDQELIFCLYCLLNDALSGYNSFDYFCSEFGYDTDSISANRTYKACMRSSVKAEKIGFENEEDLCEVLNYLSENYNC